MSEFTAGVPRLVPFEEADDPVAGTKSTIADLHVQMAKQRRKGITEGVLRRLNCLDRV